MTTERKVDDLDAKDAEIERLKDLVCGAHGNAKVAQKERDSARKWAKAWRAFAKVRHKGSRLYNFWKKAERERDEARARLLSYKDARDGDKRIIAEKKERIATLERRQEQLESDLDRTRRQLQLTAAVVEAAKKADVHCDDPVGKPWPPENPIPGASTLEECGKCPPCKLREALSALGEGPISREQLEAAEREGRQARKEVREQLRSVVEVGARERNMRLRDTEGGEGGMSKAEEIRLRHDKTLEAMALVWAETVKLLEAAQRERDEARAMAWGNGRKGISLAEENQRLRAALEWYAEWQDPREVLLDGGYKARAALAGEKT